MSLQNLTSKLLKLLVIIKQESNTSVTLIKILKYSLETKTDSLTQLEQSSRNASGLICLMANELAWRLILPEACYSNIMIIDRGTNWGP